MEPSPTQDESLGGQITLRYWASVRAETGLSEEVVDVSGPVSLASLIAGAVARHPASDRLAALLGTCSVLLGDNPVGSRDAALVEVLAGQTVEFLPPFAGG